MNSMEDMGDDFSVAKVSCHRVNTGEVEVKLQIMEFEL
jgi:hypothetical protein